MESMPMSLDAISVFMASDSAFMASIADFIWAFVVSIAARFVCSVVRLSDIAQYPVIVVDVVMEGV
ncbi:MAG: hypothetical protein ABIK45_10255, partial [Pseudomonadota bacterium]